MTTPLVYPLVQGESSYERKKRLLHIWQLAHTAELRAYSVKHRERLKELRLAANPPPPLKEIMK
jgi:hypothetical protein